MTIEHALLGTNLVLATGLEKKFGWLAVAWIVLLGRELLHLMV